MIVNLEYATKEELKELLKSAIGKAFRMASLGNEDAAIKAANNAKQIKQFLDDLEDAECPVLSVTTSIMGRSRVSNKELRTTWGQT